METVADFPHGFAGLGAGVLIDQQRVLAKDSRLLKCVPVPRMRNQFALRDPGAVGTRLPGSFDEAARQDPHKPTLDLIPKFGRVRPIMSALSVDLKLSPRAPLVAADHRDLTAVCRIEASRPRSGEFGKAYSLKRIDIRPTRQAVAPPGLDR